MIERSGSTDDLGALAPWAQELAQTFVSLSSDIALVLEAGRRVGLATGRFHHNRVGCLGSGSGAVIPTGDASTPTGIPDADPTTPSPPGPPPGGETDATSLRRRVRIDTLSTLIPNGTSM